MKLVFVPSRPDLKPKEYVEERKAWARDLFYNKGLNLPKRTVMSALGVSSVWVEKNLYTCDYVQFSPLVAISYLELDDSNGGVFLDRAAVAKWLHEHTCFTRQLKNVDLAKYGIKKEDLKEAQEKKDPDLIFKKHGLNPVHIVDRQDRRSAYAHVKVPMIPYVSETVPTEVNEETGEKTCHYDVLFNEKYVTMPKRFTSNEEAYRAAFAGGWVKCVITPSTKSPKKTLFIATGQMPGDDEPNENSIMVMIAMDETIRPLRTRHR